MTATLTAYERQRFAIDRDRHRARAERAVLVAEVDRAVAEVGWHQARPVVVSVLGASVPVTGPRGRWRGLLRKRTGARLLAALAVLPAQGRLALTHPTRSLQEGARR